MKTYLINLFYFLCINAGVFACGDVFFGTIAVLVLGFPASVPVGIITGLMGLAVYYAYVFIKRNCI